MGILKDVYGNLSSAYRKGASAANIEMAEILSSGVDTSDPAEAICRGNRQRAFAESEEAYSSSNIFGRAAYLAGLHITRIHQGAQVDLFAHDRFDSFKQRGGYVQIRQSLHP